MAYAHCSPKLVVVLSILIDFQRSLLHHTFCVSVLLSCTLPIPQLLWSACPAFGFSQLITAPGHLILVPLADAVWVSYVFQLLLMSGYAHQCILAVAAMSSLHLDSFSIMLFVALWAINKLVAAESALDKLDLEEKKAARKLAREYTGTPWLVPVHCMVPSASLIAILLIIGGVEINPGPVTSVVFTLLMLATMSGAKRSWIEAEGMLFGPGKPLLMLYAQEYTITSVHCFQVQPRSTLTLWLY